MKNRKLLLVTITLAILIFTGFGESATVTNIEVNPATATVSKGSIQQFKAVVNGSNNPSQKVTWDLTGAKSSGTSITATSGLLFIATNETADNMTITATSDADQSQKASANVTITQITSVTVSPATITVGKGKQQFTAVVNGSNNPPQTVTWVVSGNSNSDTFITPDGLLTIDETARTLTVRATSTLSSRQSGIATVTVYGVGSIGPGGGYIFYDKGSVSDGWRYLEAAPATSEFKAQWGLNGIPCPGTNTSIGTGKANTDIIVKLLNSNGETGRAAQLCAALTIKGLNGWFLPSRDELNEMYLRLRIGDNIGGFSINYRGEDYGSTVYWSSSVEYWGEDDGWGSRFATWFQSFSSGEREASWVGEEGWSYRKGEDEILVRAVRAF